ncbi:MAG: helix-turn-helix transcriptional regulator [Thermoplasmata archaeon]|nr:helix-turn-helix transcriptional regulator [Thermoplasmata archaeon]
MIPADFVVGLAVGLGVSAGGYATIRFYLVRRQHAAARRTGPTYPAAADLPDLPRVHESPRPLLMRVPMAAAPSSSGALGGAPLTASFAERRLRPESPPPTRSPTEFRTSVQIEVSEPTLQLSHRVVLHVYGQGVVALGEVAPRALCQAGMREALAARQGALAGVLQRLESAGIIARSTGHVQGMDRRVKVYRLTPRGEGLARQLRADAAGIPPHRPKA